MHEKTLLEQRCKIFKFEKNVQDWADLGVVTLKVNEDTETGKRRLLCRLRGSSKVILVWFYSVLDLNWFSHVAVS